MRVNIEITIPTTTIATSPKPHTLYDISIRLPLRSFVLQKRYSDFTTLHSEISTQAHSAPPVSLPPKTFFGSTLHNPTLTENRRVGLESYLKAINSAADSKWRETPAFKSFLNLPTNLSSTSSLASTLRSATDNTGNVSDPTVWLDVHRELKGVLHEARLHVAARDSSTVVSVGHEESAGAKKALVRAGTLISVLDKGLKGRQEEWGVEKLGEGEVRRRRDLVASARKEKETLEGLLITIARKKEVDEVVADKQSLVEGHHGSSFSNAVGRQGKQSVGKGRVLGKETSRTRELDNKGVLGLQQQMMKEQDEDVNILAEAVRRQKELSIQINEELAEQINMLDMLDEDVSRVDSKIKVARKRVDKIS